MYFVVLRLQARRRRSYAIHQSHRYATRPKKEEVENYRGAACAVGVCHGRTTRKERGNSMQDAMNTKTGGGRLVGQARPSPGKGGCRRGSGGKARKKRKIATQDTGRSVSRLVIQARLIGSRGDGVVLLLAPQAVLGLAPGQGGDRKAIQDVQGAQGAHRGRSKELGLLASF